MQLLNNNLWHINLSVSNMEFVEKQKPKAYFATF